MLHIRHRVNTRAALEQTPRCEGIEIDLRSFGGELILHHEAFTQGERLLDWIKSYRHQTLILNPKEDGLEEVILAILREAGIEDFFFLDLTIPTLLRLARRGERRLALRYSAYEPLEACLRFAGLADWVWVDHFDGPVLDAASYEALNAHFRICLAAPELAGHDPALALAWYGDFLAAHPVAAVCSDFPQYWPLEKR